MPVGYASRQTLDNVIEAIMDDRFEEALQICEDLGMCETCVDTAGPDYHCLPVKLLEGALTTHRDFAGAAHAKLKRYLEERKGDRPVDADS